MLVCNTILKAFQHKLHVHIFCIHTILENNLAAFMRPLRENEISDWLILARTRRHGI